MGDHKLAIRVTRTTVMAIRTRAMARANKHPKATMVVKEIMAVKATKVKVVRDIITMVNNKTKANTTVNSNKTTVTTKVTSNKTTVTTKVNSNKTWVTTKVNSNKTTVTTKVNSNKTTVTTKVNSN